MINAGGEAMLVFPVEEPTEDWAADVVNEDGSVGMWDWRSLRGVGVTDLTSMKLIPDDELRDRLGL